MSSHSYTDNCPNCDNEAHCYTSNKPFDEYHLLCLHCGFIVYTSAGQLSLEDLNEQRIGANNDYEYTGDDYLHPLTKLPEVDAELKHYFPSV